MKHVREVAGTALAYGLIISASGVVIVGCLIVMPIRWLLGCEQRIAARHS